MTVSGLETYDEYVERVGSDNAVSREEFEARTPGPSIIYEPPAIEKATPEQIAAFEQQRRTTDDASR